MSNHALTYGDGYDHGRDNRPTPTYVATLSGSLRQSWWEGHAAGTESRLMSEGREPTPPAA